MHGIFTRTLTVDQKTIEQIKQWVQEAKQGDTSAFGQIYDALVKPVYHYIYYRAPRHMAEDLTEETFLKAWQNLSKYQEKKAAFHSWVFRIAHNLVCDFFRKHSPDLELDETLSMPEKDQPDRQMEAKWVQMELKQAIHQLKDAYQQVIVLRYVNDLDHSEMAQVMGKSEGAVRTLQTRAVKQLRLILEKKSKK